MTAASVALAVVVGMALGLLGGGGSILMVPLLVYVTGMDAKEAIAASSGPAVGSSWCPHWCCPLRSANHHPGGAVGADGGGAAP